MAGAFTSSWSAWGRLTRAASTHAWAQAAQTRSSEVQGAWARPAWGTRASASNRFIAVARTDRAMEPSSYYLVPFASIAKASLALMAPPFASCLGSEARA